MNINKTTKRIELDTLVFDDNPRTDATLHLEAMQASYAQHGYQSDSAIMVEDQENGKYLVLRGNRRTLAALDLQTKDAIAYERAFPDGKIPAIICKGLSDNERILLRIDHADDMDRVPLDDEGMFNAIAQLSRSGLGQDAVAEHLNLWLTDKATGVKKPNRSYAQQRINLAKLPAKVQNEFRILMRKGKDATPVRWGQVATLYKEYHANCVAYPDGTIKFQELWEKATKPVEKGSNAIAGTSLTAKKAKDMALHCQSKAARALCFALTGQGDVTVESIDLTILEAESAQVTLAQIKESMGETDYSALVAELQTV